MGYDAVHLVGETDDTHTCDEEMAGHIQTYLDAVREVAPQNNNALLLVEKKVTLSEVRDDIHGTADALVISWDNKSLDVFDFKYGAGVLVEVEDNPQLMIYALGALLSIRECARVEFVRLHIVQPRHHAGGHRSCAIEAGELMSKFADEVRSAAIATDDLAEPRLSAGEHCRWCLANPHCPELRKAAMERTRHLFQEVDEATILQPFALAPAKPPPPAAGTLTTEELGSALTAFPLIETWMRAVREHAYDRAAKGDVAPGFKMVQKTGNRKWADEASVELVMEAYDVDAHEKPKLKSPAQAEKGLPNVQRERLMNQLAAKPKTGTALVPTSDKRPAVTAGDVFKEIKGESQ
jgi:hypothetical protein